MAKPCDQSPSPYIKAREQAQRQQSGFDCEFIERPQEAFQVDCPICLSVLREPYLISCCGYNFCQLCIERVQLQKGSCPTCNMVDFTVFPNKGLKRSLYVFRVHCSHKKEGCQWTGELGELDKHLNVNPQLGEQLVGCEFSKIECHHCCEIFQRRHITAHQIKECIRRPFSCDYCGNYGADFEDVTTKHWPVCGSRPVPCPNECGVYPERQNLEHHVSKDCPLTVVNCDFHYAGCDVQLPQKDMPAHLAENLVVYMSLMAAHHQKATNLNAKLEEKIREREEEISKLKEELAANAVERNEQIVKLKDEFDQKLKESIKTYVLKITELEQKVKESIETRALKTTEKLLPSFPVRFTMTNFEKYKCSRDIWYSPPFYTHPGGYRLCLKLIPVAGDNSDAICIGVCLMQGEFDQFLEWPFQGIVDISIVNQLEDSEHYSFTAVFIGSHKGNRVRDERGECSDLCCRYVSHNKLSFNADKHCCFLKDNCLCFQVTDLNRYVLRNKPYGLLHTHNNCARITMPNFQYHKANGDWWFSLPFYQESGYKVCLSVCASDIFNGTHVSVYIHIMRGQNDDLLKWPFHGKAMISLANRNWSQLLDAGDYVKIIHFDGKTPDIYAQKPEGIMNEGWGLHQYISHEHLHHPPGFFKYKYLHNDSLHFVCSVW